MPDAPSILVIEDDDTLGALLDLHLRGAGYAVEVVADGALGYQRALGTDFDLVVLDLMLPGMEGVEVCRRLRAAERRVPILMLTAMGDEPDRVRGLEIGADDYVAKPFSLREVLARVAALLRRVEMDRPPEDPAEVLCVGDLEICPAARRVSVRGEAVELTVMEFDLLAQLVRNPGRAFSRKELLDQVWGYQFSGYAHTVNTHIHRLRAKIEHDPANPEFVQTVWGVGYRLGELA